jgi:tetratricopeptide (TPR) repeat protein
MNKPENVISIIDSIHTMNAKNHEALKEYIDNLFKRKMKRWTTQEIMQVVDHLTKKNFRIHNKYFVKSEYVANIKKEIEDLKIIIEQNEFWFDKQDNDEAIFYLTKILNHLDPKYVNIKSPKKYSQWYDNYDYERVNDFIISILAHFASIDEFEEELQGLMGNFDCNKKMLYCVGIYKRDKIIREILE